MPTPPPLSVPLSDCSLKANWKLDEQVVFLNHGSFGACPSSVLTKQFELLERLERQPLRFFLRAFEQEQIDARTALANFLSAEPDNLVFVDSATAGVNTVLRSLEFSPGDELLVTDHAYNACRNALEFVAKRYKARVVVAPLPFPVQGKEELVEAVLSKVSDKTRLLLLDHITSATALILPIEEICSAIRDQYGEQVDVLIDGAHGPGMVPISLEKLGVAYYTGNNHKWLCGPKASAFLYVRPDKQKDIRPLCISHGANTHLSWLSFFQTEFAWIGTHDPSPRLCVPHAIKALEDMLQGGWSEVMERNRQLNLKGRDILCEALELPHPAPDELLGSIATIPLPKGPVPEQKWLNNTMPFQDHLLDKYHIEVPISPWGSPGERVLRISAHVYNCIEDYQTLAQALQEMLKETSL